MSMSCHNVCAAAVSKAAVTSLASVKKCAPGAPQLPGDPIHYRTTHAFHLDVSACSFKSAAEPRYQAPTGKKG